MRFLILVTAVILPEHMRENRLTLKPRREQSDDECSRPHDPKGLAEDAEALADGGLVPLGDPRGAVEIRD